MPLVSPQLPWWRTCDRRELGDGGVSLPTGRLVVGDPFVRLGEVRPLDRKVPPGAYAVRLGACDGDAVYAVVRFSDGDVSRWERASTCDVDASTAGYFDASTVERLRHDGPEKLFARVVEAGYHERPYAVLGPRHAGSLVAFGTGGDGRYTSYWGLDENGAARVLVTDFGRLGLASPEQFDAPSEGAKILPFRRRP